MEHQDNYFCLPRISIVTIAKSLLRSTRDFLKSSFHMFPYDEIVKSDLISEIGIPKIPPSTKFQQNQSKGLRVMGI